ncbi:MAG: hypothetical protein DMG36_09895 [Acidobacteria bacterium]|nr:MAG: hypothetical protein DMG36_09895 [Acidobacteriota bacterium]
MRKLILFALWLCAAVSLGPVSLAVADQAQTSGQQTATRETPHTGKQASGQKAQATQPPAIPAGFRPLSLNEGRAIVQDMAWADDEEGLAPDCSHLVHTLYEQAGHPYPYASSLDLYRGTGQFIRVRTPQPGDLIVWRGHVGIRALLPVFDEEPVKRRRRGERGGEPAAAAERAGSNRHGESAQPSDDEGNARTYRKGGRESARRRRFQPGAQ